MKKILIYILIFIILVLAAILLNKQGALIFPWEDKDSALLKALKGNQLPQFEKLLKKGANPNVIFGINPHDWVMCEATRKGKFEFLKLAVKYGGDINLRNTTPPITKSLDSIWSAPILCATTMHNYKAFSFLLENKVSLNIKVRPDTKKIAEDNPHVRPEMKGKTFYGSPLTNAVNRNEYHMVFDMLQIKKNLSWEENRHLKRRIERGGIDRKSEANQWRLKVVELLRQRGHEIDPDKGHRAFLKKYNITEEELEAQRK